MKPTPEINQAVRNEREAVRRIARGLRARFEQAVKVSDAEPTVEDQISLAQAYAMTEFLNALEKHVKANQTHEGGSGRK
jgi:hypothetical protein